MFSFLTIINKEKQLHSKEIVHVYGENLYKIILSLRNIINVFNVRSWKNFNDIPLCLSLWEIEKEGGDTGRKKGWKRQKRDIYKN